MVSDNSKKNEKKQPIFRFNADAPKYDDFIEKVIPYYNSLISELIRAIPLSTDREIHALDIGIGTGRVTEKFIKKYEYASITGLDISEEMIKMASDKFSKNHIPLTFLIQKIENIFLSEKYDCIYSCLALHHIEDDDRKAECYKKIFNSLEPQGFFVNGDVVAGEDEEENKLFRKNLRKFLEKNLKDSYEVENWMKRHLENDFPAPLSRHIKWLKEAGFKGVKIFCQKMNYVVFGGIKK